MQTLRYPRLWLIIGYVMVLAAVFGSIGPGIRNVPPAFDDKVVHTAVYFVLMIWFAGIYKRGHYLWVAVALFALGGVIEFLQGQLSHRSGELADLLANSAGIGIGVVLALVGLGSWCTRLEARLFARK